MKSLYNELVEADEIQLYAQEELIVDTTEEILFEMHRQNITKSELAKRLNRSKSFVTRLLNGDHNMTLRTLSDICFVMGLSPKIYIDGRSHQVEVATWKRANELAIDISRHNFALGKKIEIIEREMNNTDQDQDTKSPALKFFRDKGWSSAA